MDLEIQISASSVGQLQAVEAFVVSRPLDIDEATGAPFPIWVQPRDRRSAGLSYDGRVAAESLRRLTTLPVRSNNDPIIPPTVLSSPWQELGGDYVEMVHPNDVARRMIIASEPPDDQGGRALATCYGLFGHDLEKGVVLRARLRGIWMTDSSLHEAAQAAYLEFLEQPPPLGT
jgi:hypothetical protein